MAAITSPRTTPLAGAPRTASVTADSIAEEEPYSPPARSLTAKSDSTVSSRNITTTLHGSCPHCHHHHDGDRITIHVSRKGSFHNQVECFHCGQPWFGIGGSQTRFSLLSQETDRSATFSIDNYPPSVTATNSRRQSSQRFKPLTPSRLGTSAQYAESTSPALELPRVSEAVPNSSPDDQISVGRDSVQASPRALNTQSNMLDEEPKQANIRSFLRIKIMKSKLVSRTIEKMRRLLQRRRHGAAEGSPSDPRDFKYSLQRSPGNLRRPHSITPPDSPVLSRHSTVCSSTLDPSTSRQYRLDANAANMSTLCLFQSTDSADNDERKRIIRQQKTQKALEKRQPCRCQCSDEFGCHGCQCAASSDVADSTEVRINSQSSHRLPQLSPQILPPLYPLGRLFLGQWALSNSEDQNIAGEMRDDPKDGCSP